MWWLEKPALGDFYFEVSTNRFAIGFGQSARPRLNEFLPREALRFLLTAASSNKKLEFSMVNRAPESCQLCKCTSESKTDPVQTPWRIAHFGWSVFLNASFYE